MGFATDVGECVAVNVIECLRRRLRYWFWSEFRAVAAAKTSSNLRCVDLGRSPCEPAAAFDRRRYLAMTAQVGVEAGWWPTVWSERTGAFVVSGSPDHRQPGAHGGLERPSPHRRHSARRPGCGDGARGSATGRVRLGARCAVVMTKADDVPEVEIERTTQSLARTWTCGCTLFRTLGKRGRRASCERPAGQS